VHHASSVHAAGLQAGTAMEYDHHVFAESPGLFLLPFAQPLARRYHQDDRHNPPRDSEHGKKCA
jgi:hypothetical protein